MAEKKLSNEKIAALAAKFQALGDESRLRIASALLQEERSVGEIVLATKLSQPNVSRHLKVLANAGLVRKRRHGVTVFYSVVDRTLAEVCDLLCRNVAKKLQ